MATKPRKDWTLLIFMAGDNDLDQEGERDLAQMKSVDTGGRVNLVVQFDRAETGRNTRRYALRHGSSLVSDGVENLGETNCGDPQVLEDFLLWGIREYPATRLMVVIWNHGGGTDDTDHFASGMRALHVPAKPRRRQLFTTPQRVNGGTRRKIAVDNDAQDFLDNIELKRVFANVSAVLKRPIDILGMDACLMSMVEIGWQLRGTVQFMVGSQDDEPGAGWPYHTLLGELAANPSMKPAQLAQAIVATYLVFYPPEQPVTQSACEIAKLPLVIAAVDALGKALLARLDGSTFDQAILAARLQTRQFANPDFVDLHHLCGSLGARTADPEVQAACAKVQAALAQAVIADAHPAAAVTNAHGLSIYFPLADRAPLYSTLDFTADCAWGAFLARFIPQLHPT